MISVRELAKTKENLLPHYVKMMNLFVVLVLLKHAIITEKTRRYL